MPLDHHGVLLGTLEQHFRDTPDDQGTWCHVKSSQASQTDPDGHPA